MISLIEQEAEDLAKSLPFDQSQLWGGAVFMVSAIMLILWYLDRNDGTQKQLPTLLEVEAKQDFTRKRINPFLVIVEFFVILAISIILSNVWIWLGIISYLLGIILIILQAFIVYKIRRK